MEQPEDYLAAARATGHKIGDEVLEMIREDLAEGDVAECHQCGKLWPMALLDGRPGTPAGRNIDAANFERLEGPCCYGEGYSTP